MITSDTDRLAFKLMAFMRSLIEPRPYPADHFRKDLMDLEETKYIKYALEVSEEISYETRLHWSIMIWPLILCIMSLTAPLLLIIGGMWILVALANYVTSEFVITNRRVSLQTGILMRRTFESKLNNIYHIDVEQGVIGRVFGYGTLVVTGPGGSRSRFSAVSEPFEFKKAIQEQIDP